MQKLRRLQGDEVHIVGISGDQPRKLRRISQGGGGGSSYVLQPATTDSLGGIIVGEDLQITPEGVLSVIKANSMEADNTHPITAAAVYVEVGNINALLHTI